jgi:hypothetical protein
VLRSEWQLTPGTMKDRALLEGPLALTCGVFGVLALLPVPSFWLNWGQ